MYPLGKYFLSISLSFQVRDINFTIFWFFLHSVVGTAFLVSSSFWLLISSSSMKHVCEFAVLKFKGKQLYQSARQNKRFPRISESELARTYSCLKRAESGNIQISSEMMTIWIWINLDFLQVPLDKTQDKLRNDSMNSDSDIWLWICRPARETCTLTVPVNY